MRVRMCVSACINLPIIFPVINSHSVGSSKEGKLPIIKDLTSMERWLRVSP